jgi:hypothetical protein
VLNNKPRFVFLPYVMPKTSFCHLISWDVCGWAPLSSRRIWRAYRHVHWALMRSKGHFTLETVTTTLQALSLEEKAEPVQVCFTLRLRDQWSMWMHDGCKVYMDTYMASKRSCFMVTWIIFKNYLLEVGLTQNQETMAPNAHNRWFIDSIMCEDLHDVKFLETTIGWGPGHIHLLTKVVGRPKNCSHKF